MSIKWKAERYSPGDKELTIYAGDVRVLVDYDDVDHDQAERVAALIVAAPELLATLKTAFSAFSHDDAGPLWTDSLIAETRAVIAKATTP